MVDTSQRRWKVALGAAALLFSACSSDSDGESSEASQQDVQAQADATGAEDTGAEDTGTLDTAAPDAGEGDTSPGDDTDASTPGAKSPEVICAEIMLCSGDLQEFGLNRCPAAIRAAEQDRARILETQATDDLAELKRLDCLVAANGDCAAISACIQPPRVPATVCDGEEGFHQVCASDVRVDCPFSGAPTYLDCAAAGLVCRQVDKEAHCAADVPCENAACDGDVIVECNKEVVKRIDCRGLVSVLCSGDCDTLVAETCVSSGATAYCGATGPDCDGDQFVDGCQGDELVACTAGKVGKLDCPAQGDGFTCHKEESFDYFWCGPAQTGCEFDMEQTCADGVITYCDQGTVSTFDCASIGASGCELRTGIGATPFGACTP